MLLLRKPLSQCIEAILKGIASDALYLVIDQDVKEAHQAELQPLERLCRASRAVASGEHAKSLEQVAELWRWLSDEGATRESLLIVVGGGSLTDLCGFVASSYMRGIRVVYLPTTLLAMIDASIGGKTGIDFAGIKNLIGAFHLPTEIIIAPSLLKSLPQRELYSGYAELLKSALLMGGGLWERLLRLGDPIDYSDELWGELIEQVASYKASVTEQDPEERKGLRHILNLGHTVGHALEAWSLQTERRQSLLHGEAVLIGLIVEGYMAERLWGGRERYLRELITIARSYYPYCAYSCDDYPELVRLMRRDKKNKAGRMSFVLLRTIAKPELYHTAEEELVKEGLDFYREAFGN